MKNTRLISLFPLATFSCLIPLSAQAQVTPDGTTSTTVNQDGNDFLIESGDRSGNNLFHSFNEFSVPTGGSAGFNNAGDIANIFSRVTGSSISSVDGLLGANGAANLFLINPNGIIFGENASLNLGGSFFASTADSLLFEGDTEFSAVNPQAAPLLEVSIPIGARFRDDPGDIVNRASTGNGLEVSPGETIALLGGNVIFDGGGIFAPGANVEIGGLTETGTINFSENGSPTFPDGVVRGNVLLRNESNLAVPGEGGVNINARNFEINTNSAIRTGGIDNSSDSTNIQAGDVVIDATDNVVLDGTNSENASISTAVFAEAVGNASKIEITAKNISFLNGGGIFSAIGNQGETGDITLTATENITFNGIRDQTQSGILSAINPEAVGNTGNINLTAQNLFITDGASITGRVFGQGNSGDININVSDSISIERSDRFPSSIITEAVGEGDTGDINIATQNLVLSEGGQISANVGSPGNFGEDNLDITGNSGDINITAGNITVDGFFSQISNEVLFAQGNAGQLNITTNSLSLTNLGRVSTSTFGTGNAGDINIEAQNQVLLDSGGQILAEIGLGGTGNGGNIEINTSSLSILNSGVAIDTSTLSGDGDAGDINITANLIEIREESFIDAQVRPFLGSEPSGQGGDITIETNRLILSEASQITANTASTGNAGNLTINAQESIELNGTTEDNTGGLAAIAVGSGDGGNISISTNELTIEDGAIISASNFPTSENSSFSPGTGQPGNINIQANSILLQDEGVIDAATQSEVGEGANINLQISDEIILRNNSFISARALENANGGNLTINANEGFILAFPNQNNDIIANAAQGNGGNININTQAIFGLEERPSTPPNKTNDIDASSEFGLQGDFTLNTPDFDPTTGLINLPASVGDASDQISQNPCQQGVGSQFIVTGKGGLPPNVNESLNSESARVGLIEPLPQPLSYQERGGKVGDGKTRGRGENTTTTPEAIPAQGWVFNNKGEVTLTAYSTSGKTIQRSQQNNLRTCTSQVNP